MTDVYKAGLLIGTLVLIMLFAAISEDDYQREQEADAYYCEMVKSKAWPNYENRECVE